MVTRFRLTFAWLSWAAVVACGGTAKVESGAAGSSGSLTAPSSSGSSGVGAYSDGGSVAVGGQIGISVGGEPGSGGGACAVDGTVYLVGQPFACGCNTCRCEADGSISSGANGCKICVYQGELHAPGEKFPDRDGCNECECSSAGEVSCTEKACECQPEKEWYRRYATRSANECSLIDFVCAANTTHFTNGCGCGCEELLDCPRWIDCEPGNPSCSTMMKRCPFSPGAF